ncbi:MAG: hypothetical protein DWQ19_10760 [Crenarchaeota archaeon]|nr:MAG: hypothetical protein DWQ19_10760 [Thermoproteota archaeon]
MSTNNDQYDQFDQWVDQWDKAQEEGIFEKPETPHTPSAQSADSSFFGYTNNLNADSSIEEPDAHYWDSVYELSKDCGVEERKLDDDPHADDLDGDLIQEDIDVDPKYMADSMLKSANPVRPSSVGKDQDVSSPVSVGATYDVSDLEQLEKVKTKLHNLIGKLNGMEAVGKSDAKLEQQIASLSKQLDEISDSLNRSVPSQQGD